MKTFSKKVDLRSRKEMIEFLTSHFRYNTMNSWNHSTSYANNMKINHVIPQEYLSKAYELFETEDFYDEINDLIYFWDEDHDHVFQAGFNGRSGGYLVMYVGLVEYKTIFKFENGKDRDYADGYGWLSFEEASANGLYKKRIRKIGSYPSRSIDQGEDFEDWSIYNIRERVELVQSFDKLCDDIVDSVIELCKNYKVTEEKYTVVKTRKIMTQIP